MPNTPLRDYNFARRCIERGDPIPVDVIARLIGAGFNPADMGAR